jgi:transposase, IS30 family
VRMLTERNNRFTLLFALPTDRTAPTVRDSLVKVVGTIPAQMRRWLIWDNGKEMAEHRKFSVATDLEVYFCDPGHRGAMTTRARIMGFERNRAGGGRPAVP